MTRIGTWKLAGGLGLVVGLAGAMLAATATSARASAAAPAWEYLCVRTNEYHPHKYLPGFNKLGAEGWEMSGLTNEGSNPVACFKRHKP